MPDLSDDFRTMMGGFPTGVTIVAAVDSAGKPRGMTCSSLCSVTLTPPTLLTCLRHDSSTLAAVLARQRFTVNLLHAKAQQVAELFASADVDRFDKVTWRMDADSCGPHLIMDAHSVADCHVSGTQHVGDHTVVFGTVTRIQHPLDRWPLLYGLRRYAVWPDGPDSN